MQECPSKAEINDKLTHACTTDSNELITKAEANAEGFSISSTNEYMTKAEFIANLPTPPPFLI